MIDYESLEKVTLRKFGPNSVNSDKQCCHSGTHTRKMWTQNSAQEHNFL